MGFFSSIVDFFSGSEEKKTKTQHYKKTYTSNKKQNFNNGLRQFKDKEAHRLKGKYEVCSELFFPSKFRASYRFIEEYQDIRKIDQELANIDTALKEIKTMEKWYAQQKKNR